MNEERLMIFIDGSNIFHGLRHLNIRIDYGRLIEFLRESRRLVRAYFYTAIPQDRDVKKGTPEWDSLGRQKRFLEDLSLSGVKVKLARLRKLPSGEFIEKEVDIMLATDMLSLAFQNAYDTAVLVSGDSDFTYTVEEIQRIGKRVENATFKKTSSYQLRRTCDRFVLLDNFIDRFTYDETPALYEETSFWSKIRSLWKR